MAASGAVICWEAENKCEEVVTGFIRPIPPSLTGRLSRSRSSLGQGGLPVNAGMKV